MLDILLLGQRRRFLDGRSDVAAAFSLRRVNSLYLGALVRIRRSSDSLEADFGVGQSGADWGTIASFIGAGSGFVSKWYDQSGNGHDLAQSAAASQPKIGLIANGLPGMTFDGSNDILQTPAFTLNQPWSFNFVGRRVSTIQTDFENFIDGLAADSSTVFHNITGTSGPKDIGMYAGSFGPQSDNGVSMAVGIRGAVGGAFNGASSLLEVNATTGASFTGNTSTGNPGGLSVGGRGDSLAARFTNVEFQELVAFNSAHSSAQLKADNATMRSAWRF